MIISFAPQIDMRRTIEFGRCSEGGYGGVEHGSSKEKMVQGENVTSQKCMEARFARARRVPSVSYKDVAPQGL